MQTETTRFTCDAADCEATYESDEYIGGRPNDWISLGFDTPRVVGPTTVSSRDHGVRHFCSWDHVGQWVTEKIEKEREREERRKEEESRCRVEAVQSRRRV